LKFTKTYPSFWIFGLACTLLLSLSYCRNSDTQENLKAYRERVLLTLLLTPPANPSGVCMQSLRRMETCVSTAQSRPALVNEAVLSNILGLGLLSQPNQSSYSGLCQGILNTAAFRSTSPLLQSCLIDCYRKQWDLRIQTGACTSQTFSSLLTTTPLLDSACALECNRTTNTASP